jgi:hypothetical protein
LCICPQPVSNTVSDTLGPLIASLGCLGCQRCSGAPSVPPKYPISVRMSFLTAEMYESSPLPCHLRHQDITDTGMCSRIDPLHQTNTTRCNTNTFQYSEHLASLQSYPTACAQLTTGIFLSLQTRHNACIVRLNRRQRPRLSPVGRRICTHQGSSNFTERLFRGRRACAQKSPAWGSRRESCGP